jgi:hypothetical protein
VNNILKVVIALLLSKLIESLTYGKLDFFQYNNEKNFFAAENILKFFVNYGLAIAIILIIYAVLSKIFPKKADR